MPQPSPAVSPLSDDEIEERLGELAAHLTAGEARFIELLGEFDERRGWARHECASCAQWLSWRCGLGRVAATERVRVARALRELPQAAAAFAAGRLSYSKVRAVTRIATPATESVLVTWALAATAAQIERLSSTVHRIERLQDDDEADRVEQRCEVRHWVDGELMMIVACLPVEDGQLVLAALDAAAGADDASAVTSTRGDDQADDSDAAVLEQAVGRRPWARRRANAMVELADSFMTHGVGTASSADRYQVVVHVDADHMTAVTATDDPDPSQQSRPTEPDDPSQQLRPTEPVDGRRPACDHRRAGQHDTPRAWTVTESREVSTDVSAGTAARQAAPDAGELGRPHRDPRGECRFQDGPALSTRTLRRLACDTKLVAILATADGQALRVGRRTRTIPPALRRALTLRDGGCRFPGCANTRWVDGHHIRHWSDGGATDLGHLVLLCKRHHRAVHRRGWTIEVIGPGRFRFRSPDGDVVPASPALPDVVIEQLVADNAADRIEIDATTPSGWDGTPLDLDLAIDVLNNTARHAEAVVA